MRSLPSRSVSARAFEWGLTADIQAPDLETKIAIFGKKADAEAVELPDDVAIFIASRIKSNIRELEGSLIRLIAYASLTGRSIDLALAKEVLRDLLPNEDQARQPRFDPEVRRRPLPAQGRRPESQATTPSPSPSPGKSRCTSVKSLTKASLPDIGKAFGGKHHSTVIHSVRKIETDATDRPRVRQGHPGLSRLFPMMPPDRSNLPQHPVENPVE